MKFYGTIIFKKIPILRLLLPTIAGIICEFYLNIPLINIGILLLLGIIFFGFYHILSIASKYMLAWIKGLAMMLIYFGIGLLLCFINTGQHNANFIGKYYTATQPLIVTIQEPLVSKPKSYKALASINAILINNKWQPTYGNMLVYFKKDSLRPNIIYGSQIIITKPLTIIANAGNPGGFNYQQYCAFQGVYYQTFLNVGNYQVLPNLNQTYFTKWLITARAAVLTVLKNNIHSANELAVAEALLIGYRDDLDRDLVQAYSNTGVVHIIAISGLHLGMIYGLLVTFFSLFKQYKWVAFVKPIVVIVTLWGFTCIAGAVPSILRSAIMFTFIVVGDAVGKRSNIYNTLAASAFTIVIFNPFSLWDVGFQLSYAAVLSIVLFSKHIQQWFYFKNKLLKWFWGLNSVTLSAQILTLPIILYHFHQLPTLFFITNLVVVPVSGIILYAELVLLFVAWLPTIANFVGKLTEWLLWFMNDFIERINVLPFSVWNNLHISMPQTIILYGGIIAMAWWLVLKKPKALLASLCCFTLFFGLRYWDFMFKNKQYKVVVYNVPQHTGIDIIEGRQYQFIGDTLLQQDGFLRNFHLKPSRVLHRISAANTLSITHVSDHIIQSSNKIIIVIDKPLPKHYSASQKITADVIILSKNPKIYFSTLTQLFNCKQYVFDASNPAWKIKYWKKDADSLGLKYYVVSEKGAFEVDL